MFEPRVPPKMTKEPSLDDLPPEHQAAIKKGYEQYLAGQWVPVEEVEKEMRWAKDDE